MSKILFEDTKKYIELRRELHKIPEPGFAEFKTQAFLLKYLQSLPSERLAIKTWRTGILVRVWGKNPKMCIGYRTDIDALSITEQTTYEFKSEHEGFMHACGHDMHMAIALGILTYFVSNPVDNDLLFIFQPAEEGPGGAEPMMQSQEFKEWRPDQIYALHVSPPHAVGTVATKVGTLFANTAELVIRLQGKGGHAAQPHLTKDMVVAAANLIMQLQTVVSRNVDPIESGVVTIGKLTAGTRENIISENAELRGTLRALSVESMSMMKERVRQITEGIALSYDCDVELEYQFGYAQVENDHDVTRNFMDWAKEHPEFTFEDVPAMLGGEDFGYFLREIPGMMFWLGADTPYGLHHAKIEPDERAIDVGIRLMIEYITHLNNK